MYKKTVILICLIAAFGGLLVGFDQGFIATNLPTIDYVYHCGISGRESYTATIVTGGVFGVLLSGVFARFLGRKGSLVLAGFIFSTMSIISALLPSFWFLIACRFGLGFAIGIVLFIVPLYLSEIAPTSIRGSMGSLFQLMMTAGTILISVISIIIAKNFLNPHTVLSMMFVVIAAFSLMMLLGSIILPESPRWLMLKNNKQAAIVVLKRIFNTQEAIDLEISEIQTTINSYRGDRFGGGVFKGYFLKMVSMCIILQIFHQLVGVNLIIYYAPTVFGYIGIKGAIAILTVPTVNMLFTFPSIRLVEKWGRKRLLYVGAVIMMCTMTTAGLAFMSTHGVRINQIGFISKIVLLVSVVIYIFGFAISWGPVPWIICSEVFSLESREIGMTISTMVNTICAGIVMNNSLSFMDKYGNASIFFVFAIICLLAIIFLKLFVPETKGITLEKIEQHLKRGSLKDNAGIK